MGKVALIIGASRGMGRQAAITLAEHGYAVGVAAKTVTHTDKLPGTIHEVCQHITDRGGQATPIQCDVRDVSQIDNAVNHTIKTFGGLDFVMYNAGAVLWQPVSSAPLRRLDLMWEVNARGAYSLVQKVMPYFLEQKRGNMLMVSPPIYSRFFKGKTTYSMTKVAVTILVNGLANELQGSGVNVSSIWPAVATESFVTEKTGVPKSVMRKSTLFGEACLRIAEEKSDIYNGKALLDEDLMRSVGKTDFSEYRCDPATEPPRMMPRQFPDLRVAEEMDDTNNKSKL